MTSLIDTPSAAAVSLAARRWEIVGVAAATIVGAVLRWSYLGSLSVWFDEGYTAWVVNHSPGEIIRLIRADTAPPLYYLLLHFWTVVFGRSEWALRGFSATAGALTIPLVAGIARRLLRDPAAVVGASWLFALTLLQTQYAQDARAYELMSFFAAAMLYCLLRLLERPSAAWFFLLSASVAAALYTHNMSVPYAAAVGFAWLILPSPTPLRRRLRDGLISAACVGVVYVPWVVALRSQVRRINQAFWIPAPSAGAICETLAAVCGVRHAWSWDRYVWHVMPNVAKGVPYCTTAALAAGVVASIVLLRGPRRRAAAALAAFAIAPPLAAAIYSCWAMPIFLEKVFIASSVAVPVLVAGPLAWATSRAGRAAARALVAGALAVSAANVLAFKHEERKEDWRTAAAVVAALPPARHRLIVFDANEAQLPFDYYYRPRPGEVETGAPAGFFDIDPPRTLRLVTSDADVGSVRRQVESGRFDDVVVVLSHAGYIDRRGVMHEGFSDMEGRVARYFLSSTQLLERIDIPEDTWRHKISILRCTLRNERESH